MLQKKGEEYAKRESKEESYSFALDIEMLYRSEWVYGML